MLIFYLKNRRPNEWRDVQNINADVGHYIIADRPMTEDPRVTGRHRGGGGSRWEGESLYHLAVGWKGGKPDLGAICFYLKNRDPQNWRDVQHLDQAIGHYILSDRPMTEEQWIAERTKVIESKPVDSQVLASAKTQDEDA